MNTEKILKIAKKAGFYVYDEKVFPVTTSESQTEFIKKFAELIVRECQLQVDQYINDCGEVALIPDTVIMKHFGVEE